MLFRTHIKEQEKKKDMKITLQRVCTQPNIKGVVNKVDKTPSNVFTASKNQGYEHASMCLDAHRSTENKHFMSCKTNS